MECDRTECDEVESGNLGKNKGKGIQGQGQIKVVE